MFSFAYLTDRPRPRDFAVLEGSLIRVHDKVFSEWVSAHYCFSWS